MTSFKIIKVIISKKPIPKEPKVVRCEDLNLEAKSVSSPGRGEGWYLQSFLGPPQGQLLWPQLPQGSSPARSRPRHARREYLEAGPLDLQRLQALLYHHPRDTVQSQSQLPDRDRDATT